MTGDLILLTILIYNELMNINYNLCKFKNKYIFLHSNINCSNSVTLKI